MLPPSTTLKDRGWKVILASLFLIFLQSLSFAQPQPDDALCLEKGRSFSQRGNLKRPLAFQRVTTEFPKSPLLNEAKFRMGICYTQLKRPKDAIRILNELLPTFLAPPRMVQIFTLLGDNYLELKDRRMPSTGMEKQSSFRDNPSMKRRTK